MLDHGGFIVSDMARARRFYSAIAELLGLQILDGGPTRATRSCTTASSIPESS